MTPSPRFEDFMAGFDDFLQGRCVRALPIFEPAARSWGQRWADAVRAVGLAAIVCATLGGCEWSEPVPSLTDGYVEPGSDSAEEADEGVPNPEVDIEADPDLDGQWLIGHGERFRWMAQVDGNHATVTTVDGTVVYEGAFVARRVEGSYWQLEAGASRFEALVRGPNEFRAFGAGEPSAWTVKRASYVPGRFDGAWTIGMGPEDVRGGTAYFTSEVWRVIVNETAVREGRIFDLEHRDGVRQIALPVSDSEYATANFMDTPGGSLLIWFAADDGYMVLYRDDNAPAWIPTPDRPEVPAEPGDEVSE